MIEKPELSAGIIELKGEQKAGMEHKVWLDKAENLVRKIPSWLGELWQVMLADFARRDLRVMREEGVDIMPTNVRESEKVSISGKIRNGVAYVLEQPLFQQSHPMTYGDLLHHKVYRDTIFDLARIGRGIQEKGLGLDLLGGKAFNMLFPAINPVVTKMRTGINNLLIADEDIVAHRDWPDFGISKGNLIARQGEVKHCDTRLYDWNKQDRTGDRIVRYILRKTQEVQDTVLWTLLADFGYKVDKEYGLEINNLRRTVKKLVEHAIPKMRLHAEMMV